MNIQDIKDLAPWVSSVIAFATLYINTYPKFKAWCRKEQKRIRLNKFFNDSFRFIDYETISISKFEYNSLPNISDDRFVITFYKYQNIFKLDKDDIILNGTKLERGFHLYEIISDHCIRLDFINDDTGEIKSAFIYYKVNIPHKIKYTSERHETYDIKNQNKFKRITSWLYD